MFSNLRTNSQIYILHKDTKPYIEIGSVISVSQPVPKLQTQNYLAPPEFMVDVTVRVNDNTVTLQKLPASLEICEQGTGNGSIVVATSRDTMNAEINAIRQRSIGVIGSMDYHKKVITDCDLLLQSLNPEIVEQRQQKQEIDSLKSQMSELMQRISDLTVCLRKDNEKKE